MIRFLCANALNLPLEDESIQCVVTSPPYWALRKYSGQQQAIWGGRSDCAHQWGASRTIKQPPQRDHDGFGNTRGVESSKKGACFEVSQGGVCECGAWQGSFGLEPSLNLYIRNTMLILSEIRRVLKKEGVVFWNIGDSYAGGGNYHGINSENTLTSKQASNRGAKGVHQELGALGKDVGSAKPKDLCLIPQRIAIAAQEDGWWVRSDIIWNKPNPMPESVRDRPTDAYEHILMFTKSAKYYWDAAAVAEPAVAAGKTVSLGEKSFSKRQSNGAGLPLSGNSLTDSYTVKQTRNLRNVWTFPPQPYRGAHFAVFPERIPFLCISAASRPGDWILDPFGGSGTTGKVANELGRNAVLCDLNYEEKRDETGARTDYLILAQQRICPQNGQADWGF